MERIHPFAEDVGSVIPEGFAAYARLFHPAHRGDAPVRWSEVAAANGRVSHPEMQWPHISGVSVHSGASTPGLWDCEPEVGSLPLDMAELLVEALGPHTTTPELVWFAVWDGFGGLAPLPEDRVVLTSKPRFGFRRHRRRMGPQAPAFALPGRTYQLFSGTGRGHHPIDDHAARLSIGQLVVARRSSMVRGHRDRLCLDLHRGCR